MFNNIAVKRMMESNMAEEFDDTGLTLEEMELAREMLEQKLAEAEKGNMIFLSRPKAYVASIRLQYCENACNVMVRYNIIGLSLC